jgi:hydrogenase large subunit
MAATIDLNVSPLGRAGGGLDVRVAIADGVVTDAWTQAVGFRGLAQILRGKDLRAGLVVTPRLGGAASGAHVYKAAYALDDACGAEVPPNATLIRNICQAVELLQAVPRSFYALFAVDLAHPKYAGSKLAGEIRKRFTAFTGTSYQAGLFHARLPAEVFALFAGQWPHSSAMIPGGVMGAPTLDSVTRAAALLGQWQTNWLERQWLGCPADRWLANQTWDDVVAWVNETKAQFDSDLGLFIRYALDIGLDKFGAGYGQYLAAGTGFAPELFTCPAADDRGAALVTRSGVYAGGTYHEYDPDRVSQDVAHSFYRGEDGVHPINGTEFALDPAEGRAEGKYSFAKAPRYDVPGVGRLPLEAGPLARRIIAAQPKTADHQDFDPVIADIFAKKGPSVFLRVLARVHEAPVYLRQAQRWLQAVDFGEPFFIPPAEPVDAEGYGGTEAPAGALQDWVVLRGGRIANYNTVTPSDWNTSPRDRDAVLGPMEKAFIGTPIADSHDPVELGHVARSFA